MSIVIIYTFLSVIIVSAVSLLGIIFFAFRSEMLKKLLLNMVSFSAGALFADVLIHLLPEAIEKIGTGIRVSLFVLTGIIASFIMEKFIHWRHNHAILNNGHGDEHEKEHVHPFAIMNLFGDFLHNFIDGLIIAASYLASIPAGIATTIAVIFHEIPQEIGDFGVLLHGGYTKKKAIILNFVIALSAIVGAALALIAHNFNEQITNFLLPFASGTFIYIAGSDLIPELQKETNVKRSVVQLIWFCLGVAMIAALLWIE